MVPFTLIQMNHTNRAIAPQIVLIEPNMPNVNTPLKTPLRRSLQEL